MKTIRALRMGVHVVIGTPGRLLDHLYRKTLRLDNVKIAVWMKLTKCWTWVLLRTLKISSVKRR